MKIIYLMIGIISLALGIIGIFLPVLPTTPFLLLTSFCFAKGSEKFHRWFIGTSLYKKYLDDFVKSRTMSLKTKISILIPASTMLLFPLLLMDHTTMRLFIGFLYVFKYYYFIFKIKTI